MSGFRPIASESVPARGLTITLTMPPTRKSVAMKSSGSPNTVSGSPKSDTSSGNCVVSHCGR